MLGFWAAGAVALTRQAPGQNGKAALRKADSARRPGKSKDLESGDLYRAVTLSSSVSTICW
jgi:hypothetical protein